MVPSAQSEEPLQFLNVSQSQVRSKAIKAVRNGRCSALHSQGIIARYGLFCDNFLDLEN